MGLGGVPCPKPERGSNRRSRRSKRNALAKKFRDAVWARGDVCEVCGAGPLLRTLDVLHSRAGHVSHDRGRRVAPADRFNPDAAKLKCRTCHLQGDHGMRF
jgi:hypothetical protein